MGLRSILRRARRGLVSGPRFASRDVEIGGHVRFGRNVVFNCRRVRIGDGVRFHDDVTVNADVFEIGDYGTVYERCFFPGPGELRIGHNFWLGPGAIVDSQGGTRIGNNVGIGAHSQLWTHMVFGDVMYGCRFHGAQPLEIGDDAWLVGHCLVSPVRIGARSLAMLGSVITREMESDRCYAGVPARDITEKVGPPFAITDEKERVKYLRERLEQFAARNGGQATAERFRIATGAEELSCGDPRVTVFNVADRTYTKRGTELEHRCLRFLLPDAKFLPIPA